MNPTSLDAYNEIRPLLSTRRRQVLDAIKAINGPFCDKMIRDVSGLPLESITGRRGWLVKAGIIFPVFKQEYQSRTKIQFYRINDNVQDWDIDFGEKSVNDPKGVSSFANRERRAVGKYGGIAQSASPQQADFLTNSILNDKAS